MNHSESEIKEQNSESMTHPHLGYRAHLCSLHLEGDVGTETDSDGSTTDGQRHSASLKAPLLRHREAGSGSLASEGKGCWRRSRAVKSALGRGGLALHLLWQNPSSGPLVAGGPACCSLSSRGPGSPPSLSALGASTGSWLQGSQGVRTNQIHLHNSHYPVSPISSPFSCALGKKPLPLPAVFSEVNYASAEGLALPFPSVIPHSSPRNQPPSSIGSSHQSTHRI